MTAASAPVNGRTAAGSLAARAIRAVLIHPAAMRVKHALRDVRWRIKGRGIENPPGPPSVRSVLFVCLGNICRSPFAARLAERIANETGRSWMHFTSAGLRATQASRSPREACRASAAYGIDLGSHEPRALTADLMTAYDAIVVLEASHLAYLREGYPERADRVFLLSLFDDGARGAYERFNIADPFGGPPAAFDECYSRISRALRRWLELAPERVLPHPTRTLARTAP